MFHLLKDYLGLLQVWFHFHGLSQYLHLLVTLSLQSIWKGGQQASRLSTNLFRRLKMSVKICAQNQMKCSRSKLNQEDTLYQVM